jgi:hypothetical protein
MILSEHTRRWAEIQFYYFCLDVYHIKNNMIDVVLLIEVISQIGNLNFKMLKTIAAKIIGDPIYLPHRDEAVSLAHLMKMSQRQIAETFGVSKTTVNTILNSERNRVHVPFPQLELAEDEEIYKFNQIFSQIKKAGL